MLIFRDTVDSGGVRCPVHKEASRAAGVEVLNMNHNGGVIESSVADLRLRRTGVRDSEE